MAMQMQGAGLDKRRYPRLKHAFLVKFQCFGENNEPKGEVYKGFTRDVGKAGMLIGIKRNEVSGISELTPNKTRLKLLISIPADSPPVDAIATVKWTATEPEPDMLFFGVGYDKIGNAQHNMISRYIGRLRIKYKVFLWFAVLFAAVSIVSIYYILTTR